MQRRIKHFHVVDHMRLRDEDIFPTVVVEILQANTPSGSRSGQQPKAGLNTLLSENTPALIVKHDVKLMRKFGDDDVGQPVIVVVLKDHSHA